MAGKSDNFVGFLGVTPEQGVGYVYSGTLSLVCFALIDPNQVKAVQQTLGSLLLAGTVATLGVGIYTFYFRVLGELVLFPFQYWLHHRLDRARHRAGESQTATVSFLNWLGVPLAKGHFAYQEIKATQ